MPAGLEPVQRRVGHAEPLGHFLLSDSGIMPEPAQRLRELASEVHERQG